jgi:predicted lactoylglutathione lyase
MTRPYTIWPLRFSPKPAAMIEFFGVLGLRKALSHADGTYASFDGRSGRLGVHSAAQTASGAVPTHTALNFTSADITAAAKELAAAGLQVQVWDETYGKQGVVTTPTGLVIGLNEDTQDDLYGGYQMHEPTVAAPTDVVAVCLTDHIARDAAFFASFGFTADSFDDPSAVRLHADEPSGVIRLHRGEDAPAPTIQFADDQFGTPYVVQLGFETSEALDALAARLRDAGYQTATVADQAMAHLSVTDPDGEEIRIKALPKRRR